MIARIGVTVPSNKAITYVKINNLGEDGLSYSDIRNSSFNVRMTITSSPGVGINLRLEAYAIVLN